MGTFEIVLVAAVLGALAFLVVSRWRNPIVDVADELRSQLQPAEVESLVVPLLKRSPKVDVVRSLPGTYTLSYVTTPLFAWLIVIFAFPIGLLALFIHGEQTLTVSITQDGEGSRVQVLGQVHSKLAAAFGAALRFELDRAAAGA